MPDQGTFELADICSSTHPSYIPRRGDEIAVAEADVFGESAVVHAWARDQGTEQKTSAPRRRLPALTRMERAAMQRISWPLT